MADSDIPDFKPMTPPAPDPPAPIASPPTIRPDIQAPRSSTWPLVIGVICIVFGILGILGGICGIGSTFLQGAMFGAIPEEDLASMEAVTTRFMPLLLGSAGLNMVVALVLAIGGFGLTSRRVWSRRVLVHWSWIRMLAVIAAVTIAFFYQQAFSESLEQAMSEDGSDPPPQGFGTMMGVFGGIQLVLTLLWGWALPIFCLIWFSRKTIREEVESWA